MILLGRNSIPIMNVYWVQWYKYFFMRWKMKCSNQLGFTSLNGTFHLSPNENICTIARMGKHSLFVLYNLYKDTNSLNKFKKHWKNDFSSSKTLTSCASEVLYAEVLRGCLRHAKRTHCACCICTAHSFTHSLSYKPRLSANVRRLYRKYWTL